jgi:hypothetical protein
MGKPRFGEADGKEGNNNSIGRRSWKQRSKNIIQVARPTY